MSSTPHLRVIPGERGDRLTRDEILERLNEAAVQAVYDSLGVRRFKAGGPGDWRCFVPWRDNRNDEAMTIRKADGVWQDHALGEGGSIFDAAMRAGVATDFPGAIAYIAGVLGLNRAVPVGKERRHDLTLTYDYTDELGNPLYRAERIEELDREGRRTKRFVQRHWRGEELVTGLPAGVRRVPYRLAELANPANRDKLVYLVEGEKCAEALAAAYGVLSTTFVGASWVDSYAGDLDGRQVVILPDRDEPGWKKANEWAQALLPRAATVKVVDLVELGPRARSSGLDIADWIDQGRGYERLAELVATTPAATLPERKELIVFARSWLNIPFTAPEFLVTNLWTPNSFGVIAAAQKSFKSFFVVDLLCSIAAGYPFLGRAEFHVPAPRRVVYWMEEGSTWDFQRRVKRWCQARTVAEEVVYDTLGLIAGERLRVGDEAAMERLADACRAHEPALVICDTLAAASVGLDENKTNEMSLIVDGFKRLKDEQGVAVAYVHHLGRSGRPGLAGWRGSTVLGAAADCWVTIDRREITSFEITIEPGLKDAPPIGSFKAELRDAPIQTVDGQEVQAGALFWVGKQSKAEAARDAAALRYEDVASWIDEHSRTGWMAQDTVAEAFGFNRRSVKWDSFKADGEAAGWWRLVRQPTDDGPRRISGGQRAMGLQITRSHADG